MRDKEALIPVAVAEAEDEGGGKGEGKDLGHIDGKPDAVDAEDERQHEHAAELEYQRAGERNESGNGAVVKGCKPSGCEHIVAADDERDHVDPHRIRRQVTKVGEVPDEDGGYLMGKEFDHHGNEDAGDGDQR